MTPYISLDPNYFKQIIYVSKVYLNNVEVANKALYAKSGYLRHASGVADLEYNEKNYCTSPLKKRHDTLEGSYYVINGKKFPLFLEFPCGKCLHCNYDKRNQLEYRAAIEACDFPNVYFLTLTYDDHHLPRLGLCKEHVQLFFKTLRNRLALLAKYRNEVEPLTFHTCYCGEYAFDEKYTKRAHYHALIYFHRQPTYNEISDINLMLRRCHPLFLNSFQYGQKLKEDPYFSINYRSDSYFVSYCRRNDIDVLRPKTDASYLDLWPHGIIYRFERCDNPIGSARYIMKYITKAMYSYSDRERADIDFYQNPMFFQTPRKRALGAYHPERWLDIVKYAKDKRVELWCPGFVRNTNSPTVYRCKVPLPKIIYEKLIPSIGRIYPNLMTICKAFNIMSHYQNNFKGDIAREMRKYSLFISKKCLTL